MTHRSDRIPLTHDMSRCEPQACVIKHRCARWLAEVPRMGSISDYSRQDLVCGGTALCDGYIDISALRAVAKPVAKSWGGS